MKQYKWSGLLVFIAILFVCATIFYSTYVASKIANTEKKYVREWIQAQQTILSSKDSSNLNLATQISADNEDIPIIETSEKEVPTGNALNLDTASIASDSLYLIKKLAEFKKYSKEPIVVVISDSPYVANHYYYGPSKLLQEVEWYPYIQLLIVALFVFIAVSSLRSRYKNEQDKLWLGMAKETAHQLGTPVSSLQGWITLLKEKETKDPIVFEIEKDIERLQLISDRFGKIGSAPQLTRCNPFIEIERMVAYMKLRSSKQVVFECNLPAEVFVMLSAPLFDWVLENLIKNALDATEGTGKITILASVQNNQVIVTITDTGKGMDSETANQIFEPGYTTKKRGWGLGLPLSKRIMESYHKGKLFIKQTELGKGTTFCLQLPIVN
jgi:signal transduction histidine kinase